MERMPTEDLASSLCSQAHDLRGIEQHVANVEIKIEEIGLEIANLKADLERYVGTLQLNALQSGTIDGKNAETRKLQLDALVESDEAVQQMRAKLADLQQDERNAKHELAICRADARHETRRFDVYLAVLRSRAGDQRHLPAQVHSQRQIHRPLSRASIATSQAGRVVGVGPVPPKAGLTSPAASPRMRVSVYDSESSRVH